jgi:cysteine synthase
MKPLTKDLETDDIINQSILSAIGNTPIVRLNRVIKNINFRLFVKLEALNPGGSIKDRSALSLIKHGIELGYIDSDTVVIESSSGNMGIGLAQVCKLFGLRFICVVDTKETLENQADLRDNDHVIVGAHWGDGQ